MRRFKISVDGVAYDVMVQELEMDGRASTSQPSDIPRHSTDPEIAAAQLPPNIKPAAPPVQSSIGDVASPLAGTVIEVEVSAGQTVKSGDLLLVLEAMKMESVVVAPIDGRVQNIAVSRGQSVQEGQVLMSLTAV